MRPLQETDGGCQWRNCASEHWQRVCLAEEAPRRPFQRVNPSEPRKAAGLEMAPFLFDLGLGFRPFLCLPVAAH